MVHLRQFLKDPAGRAIGIIFAISGLVFGTWASFIPYVKDKFQLDEAELGLLLLCMPAGIFIMNPLTIFIISRWGAVNSSIVSVSLTGLAFILPIIMPHVSLVAFGLILAGGAFSATNVAMNTCATHLEQGSGLRLMSACHGMWSLGAMMGGILSGLALIPLKLCCDQWIDGQKVYALFLGIAVCFIAWKMKAKLSQIEEARAPVTGKRTVSLSIFKPNKALWILISIILCTYLTEGAIADWSAVYMKEIIRSPSTMVGWGFAVYAFFMASGRFIGDDLIVRYGNMVVLRAGGLCVVGGLVWIIMATSVQWVLPGFMLTGLGISIASPILYAAAARVPNLAPGVGLATMNSFGMVAFLGGPVLIGFMAKALDLRIAFMFVVGTAVIWVILTTVIIRKKTS